MRAYHQGVMQQEVVEAMVLDSEAAYLDATLGGGGHSSAILARLGPKGRLISLDRDPEAIAHCQETLGFDPRVALCLAPFSRLGEFCKPKSLAGALFDLGVSSHQLDAPNRGFSFASGMALDMRMGPDAEWTALEWLKSASEEEMAHCFRHHSDLDRSRVLARRIAELLLSVSVPTSDLLRQAVADVYATHEGERARMLARVFQAIRMQINRELPEVKAGLTAAVTALAQGGKLCVLSYHSVEDREVKEVLRTFEQDCICPPKWPVCQCGGGHRTLRKSIRKPLEASPAETASNPRARSAKLRIMEKV